MMKRWRIATAAGALMFALMGCANGGGAPVPTGDELVAQAKQHYLDYRAVTNDIQALIDEGPWKLDGGSFGMQPSSAGCPDGSYNFSLTRSTHVDRGEHDAMADAVRTYLADAGYEYEGMELGSAESGSSDVIVREQGDFSLLMVTFIRNGNVLVSADTKCWPGDDNDLAEAIFGGVYLSDGYLPREESPSDPLFFGVTPGEPGFGPTPTPTPTP